MPKTVLKKPSGEHILYLRGHKNRDNNYFLDCNLSKDWEVQFADILELVDTDMLDVPINESSKRAPKGTQNNPKEK